MKRTTKFQRAVGKPRRTQIQDSRFMSPRQLVMNPEKQRIATYMDPGRGPNGEHQS